MNRYRPHLRRALIVALVFGLGTLLGAFIAGAISKGLDPFQFLVGNQAQKLVQGIILAFLLAGLAGIVAGFAGGWSLPVVGERKNRAGYGWKSGIIFGVAFGSLIFPLVLIISLLGYYEVSSTPPTIFGIVFGIGGLIFGLIIGIVLSMWTLRRANSKIIRWAMIGFGLGGVLLGVALQRFLLSVNSGTVELSNLSWLSIGFFMFSACGGFGLALAYGRAGDKFADGPPLTHRFTTNEWLKRMTIIGVIILVLALLIRPVLAAVGDMLTPVDAGLSPVLELQTIGTHWFGGNEIAGLVDPSSPAMAMNQDDHMALAWVEDNALFYTTGNWSGIETKTEWQKPVQVSGVNDTIPSDPAVAVDQIGRVVLAWVEQVGGGSVVFITICDARVCNEPLPIGNQVPESCPASFAAENQQPAIAIDDQGQAIMIWKNRAGLLPFVTWFVGSEIPSQAAGCVPLPEEIDPGRLALAAESAGVFDLLTAHDGDIVLSNFKNDSWTANNATLGQGSDPALTIFDGAVHAAWCAGADVVYWHDNQEELVAELSCNGAVQTAVDDHRQVHVLWYGEQVENSSGSTVEKPVIYESVRIDGAWTPAAIAGWSALNGQPALTAAMDGSLHLAWPDQDNLRVASQVQYQCDEADLSPLAQVIYDAGRSEQYIPAQDPIPYCGNQYDRIIFTPNPDPAFSDEEVTTNGAFDQVAQMISGAEYEVLVSTMWYDEPANNDSPGAVVAGGVAELYEKVKANLQQYPRGMTVRILLDNPPEMARGDFTGQLWTLLGDLRAAGIDKMVDEEIGWRLEVADFEGSFPHSHVKTVIIDGKTAVAAGFNMSYIHFEKDHPSGKGNDRFDMGLQITGPVAQPAMRMFDDMWAGADQRYCLNFNPPLGIPWQATCFDKSAVADHVPEVLKYYLPGDNAAAFSLYRSKVHNASDVQIVQSLAAAQESIDIIQVNFALDLICNLNIIFDICTSAISPNYVPALFEAAGNGAKIRLIIKPSPFEGIENNVAIAALEETIDREGLTDQFELRFYEGDMHPKVALIDDQLLIVGSQNFHYSAFGEGAGLNEFSFAVEDGQAVQDFKQAYEWLWEQSVPVN